MLAALLLAGAVLGRTARTRSVALALVMGLTPVLLVADVWNSAQLQAIRAHPLPTVAAAALGALAIAGAARLFVRHPAALPVAVTAVLPFRVPATIGGETANLLVPLYGVIAAGAVAALIDRRGSDAGPVRAPGVLTLERLLFGFVALYAVQATYSSDLSQAVQNVAFFYIPFGILYLLVVRAPWTPRLVAACLVVLAALALLFCAVAFVQEATHHVFINDKLKLSNTYNAYFRANSLFFDPNIFGRFLVVVTLLVAAVAAWGSDRRQVRAAIGVVVVLWAGLLTTLSQSSFGALLVGLVVLAAARGRSRRAAAVAAGAVVLTAAVLVTAAPGVLRLDPEQAGSVRKATSGRSELVQGAVDLFADRPALGWGSGAFAVEYRRTHPTSAAQEVAASHTIPLTVAVEQGVVGLAVYAGLLAGAFRLLLRRAHEALPRVAVAAAFTAVVFHTFGYAAFLEDPLTWALLAVGAVLARRAPAAAPAPATPAMRPAVAR